MSSTLSIEYAEPKTVKTPGDTVVSTVLPDTSDHDSSSESGYELVIQPRQGWLAIDWRELFRYRELLFFLTWRDYKVRYKQTFLGVAWAVLQPVLSMVIFTVIFGNFADFKSQLPVGLQDKYALFVFAGLLPWQFFSAAVTNGGGSLVSQQNLLTKIYFPRLFVPSAIVGAALVDMAISIGVFAILSVCMGLWPTWNLLALPLLLGLLVVASLGIAYLLSALTVTYRDARFIIPFMVQAWLYVSPVVYPLSLAPAKWHWALALNPMCGIIEGFRSALLGTEWQLVPLAISTTTTTVLFLAGLYYFRQTEGRFADIA